jgi:membrane-associated phospholipid phosphatase
MSVKISKFISILFHPVLIPTLGFLLLFNSGFYFSMLTWEAKRFVLLVVLLSTGILPIISVAILALNPKFSTSMEQSRNRIIPLLSSAVFYYLGSVLLEKMRAFPIFRIFLIASILVIVIIVLVSFKWKISNHMAAVGGITGTLLALSFRTGVNPVWSLLFVFLVSGVVGTARLVLEKHNLKQIVVGYAVGFLVLYSVVYFI